MAETPPLGAWGAGDEPANALAAVTHPDPYAYYARLAAEAPLAFDAGLGLFVAAGADAVRAVLSAPACRVRPATEPVPLALMGTPAEPLFRALARTNDGAVHARARAAVASHLGAFDRERVEQEAARRAERLVRTHAPTWDSDRLADFAFALPCHVIGRLLGIADDALDGTTQDVGALVRCLFPGSSPSEVAAGAQAAGRLLDRFARGSTAGSEAPLAVANAIGLLAQARDATAGLLGNTLLALARSGRARVSPGALDAIVAEVSRLGPPIQNTRRFVAEPVSLLGRRLAPGDAVLVVLASVRSDPADTSAFGVGAHACPGRDLALSIVRAGVAQLLAAGLDASRLDPRPAYPPSPNARLPLLRLRRA